MLKTSLYPLRNIAGDAIPIDNDRKGDPAIRLISQSDAARQLNLQYQCKLRTRLQDALEDPEYKSFLPEYVADMRTYVPAPGVANLTPPPIKVPMPLASLSALSNDPNANFASRDLNAQFRIRLAQKALVGGICFGGFPYIPTRPLNGGLSLSNFGLPRTWTLTARPPRKMGLQGLVPDFIDDEAATTRQELVSHSGFHFLSCDPVLTSEIFLTLSDWPKFILKINRGNGGPEAIEDECFGFLVPYFWVFQYQESATYKSRVHFGLLSSNVSNVRQQALPKKLGLDHVNFRGINSYESYSAASLFNGQRSYGQRGQRKEYFISRAIPKNGIITLYVEQAEQFNRCVAGICILPLFVPKISLKEDLDELEDAVEDLFGGTFDADSLLQLPQDKLEAQLKVATGVPSDVALSANIRIRIWEIDPLEGVAPTVVPPGSSHSSLLVDWQVDELHEIIEGLVRGVPFRRVTNARYLAIELQNLDDQSRQLVISRLEFIQSAHVSVGPRPSRAQQVRTLNFRLVGKTLAEDLSRLGDEGFRFSIEHWTAFERKTVLFKANSLFDLLHAGVARVQANSRRRAAEFERSEYNDGVNNEMRDNRPNYDKRLSEIYSNAWRRNETGDGAQWGGKQWLAPVLHKSSGGRTGFESFQNQETRAHIRHIYPRKVSDARWSARWSAAATFGNAIDGLFSIGNVLNDSDPLIDISGLNELTAQFRDYWRGIQTKDLVVMGTTSVLQSPYSLVAVGGATAQSAIDGAIKATKVVNAAFHGTWDAVAATEAVTDIGNVAGVGAMLAILLNPIPDPVTLAIKPIVSTMLALNGLTINASIQPGGLGVSFGSAPGNLFPVITQNATVGSQGTITKQASLTGYAYSQNLSVGGDESESRVYSPEGLMKRKVVRSEVPRDQSRIRGAEVMFRDDITDVVSGVIPLNLTLPARATKEHYQTSDESIRVRFGFGAGKSVEVDFWFDVIEEAVRDDH